ncbi:unnamed protein product [Strongylus vulgaris]|uniref:Uncharacterized protein n=1 Tax=Strongylus vulgaris TaxID=40348 RepID=A0A3P7K4R1_STRVU|nr:unnamed protein product [Strongylus vulgaris]
MAAPFNPGPSGITFEQLGSPRSERNYGGISPITHAGRFSQPDLRYWDPGIPFYLETTPFSSYIPMENVAYVSEAVAYQQPPVPPPPPPLSDSVVVLPEAAVDELVEQPDHMVQHDITNIYEEITHARCIECDRVIDSREGTHDRSSCTLKKYFRY